VTENFHSIPATDGIDTNVTIRYIRNAVLSIVVVILVTFAVLNRNYARALEQCERYHTRETCMHVMR
jgi:hypothetical protein